MSFVAFTQISHTSLGLRSGKSTGISAKHYLNDLVALEGILSMRESGMQITALSNFHLPAFSRYFPYIYWYYGFGGHAGYYSRRYWRKVDPILDNDRRAPLSLGIDAVIGLTYKPPLFPIAFALDYKPYVDLYRYTNLKQGATDLGFSVRYVF